MKKLVTALIVILPIVLLVALFAVTGIVRISAAIPATGIVVNNKGEDGVKFFDLTDYDSHPLYESDLGVEVLPRMASNRDYTLKITDASGKESSDLVTKDENGAFRLHGVGVTKLTFVSRDGGYSDSVLFNVTASGPLSFMPKVSDDAGDEYALEPCDDADYKLTLNSGDYTLNLAYEPSSIASASVTYESSNNEILRFIDANGRFKARFGGETIISVSVTGARGILKKTIKTTVLPASDVTVDGYDADGARIVAPLYATSVSFGLQSKGFISQSDISISGNALDSFAVTPVPQAANAFDITLNLKSAFTEETSANFTIKLGAVSYDVYVEFASRSFGIYAPSNKSGVGDIFIAAGVNTGLVAACHPFGANISYSFELEDSQNIKIVSSDQNSCIITALADGETTLRVKWTEKNSDGDTVAEGTETRRIKSVVAYSSLLFAESASTYGLENMLAIASHRYVDLTADINEYILKFRAYGANGETCPYDDVLFTSSNPSRASVEQRGNDLVLTVHGTGEVTLNAEWKYGKYFGVSPASFIFRAVNGVEVTCDKELRLAFREGRAAVLANDIYLGENLFEKTESGRRPKYPEEQMREKLLEYTGELPTTGDWKYYENLGMPHPTVRYCLDITEDIHGNGHVVNAQYITDMLDGTDKPYDFALFKGPLDFVSTNPDGIKLACVKAQDNIVFLIRTDGVTVNNAVLKGCDDQTLYDDGAINLSLLNSMGTTLEIMADASVRYSRVMNGRTVVRVFGRDGIDGNSQVSADYERIFAVIDGCILQNAREFILKTGTNRVIRGTAENPSPSLLKADGKEYGGYNSSACDAYAEDDYFVDNYLLTDVTLKDSVLRTSGLFAIGMESHFAGPMLAGSDKVPFVFNGWRDLAGTSYPAALRLVGDVVIADWKNIAAVDSSTLIEYNTAQESLAFLSLNIDEMLKTVREFGGDKYKNLIADNNGAEFVHGGIAFFGGGKNYSVLDTSKYTFEKMNDYPINLSILTNSSNSTVANQGLLLPLAAGIYDFRFVMFDATSNFDYNAQEKL